MKRLLLLAFLAPLALIAQQWDYQAPVPPAKSTGYHDIQLPPALTCRLHPKFGNVRLLDTTGSEVPFLFYSTSAAHEQMAIEWLPRTGTDYSRHWYSQSLFSNPKGELLDRLVLRIRNADVQQHFWLSGSDDMTHWYIIKEDYSYDAAFDPRSGSNLLTIHFPPVDYKYFKVELRHYWREPIQIMGAGVYRFKVDDGVFRSVPAPVPTQEEENRSSRVVFPFDAPHYFDRLYFEVDGPELYHRAATLQRQLGTNRWEDIQHFDLDSRKDGLIKLEGVRATALRLVVHNKDDKPLRIAGLQAWQTHKYMTARLEPGKDYRIMVGPEDLRAPEYDLSFFEDNLPKNRPALLAADPVSLRQPDPAASATPAAPSSRPDSPQGERELTTPQPTQSFLQHPAVLWGGILLIVLVVGYMSLRLLRDMGPGKGTDPS